MKKILTVLLFCLFCSSWATLNAQEINLDNLDGPARSRKNIFLQAVYNLSDYVFYTRLANKFPDKYYYKKPYGYANAYSGTDFYVNAYDESPDAFNHLFQVSFAGGFADQYTNALLDLRLHYLDWAFNAEVRSFFHNDIEPRSSFTLVGERKNYSGSFWDSSLGLGLNSTFFETDRKDNLVLQFQIEIFPFFPVSLAAKLQQMYGQNSGHVYNLGVKFHYESVFLGADYNMTQFDANSFVAENFINVKFGYYY